MRNKVSSHSHLLNSVESVNLSEGLFFIKPVQMEKAECDRVGPVL